MNDIKIEDLKIIMADLIKAPHIQDERYKSAYIDGVLDFFNKLQDKIEK